jgi:hypothetical protein
MLWMALWHIVPLPLSKIALPIQLSGLVANVTALWWLARIAARLDEPAGSPLAAPLAVALLAGYLPFTVWSLRGVESAVLGALLAWAVCHVLEAAPAPAPPRGRALRLVALLALGTGVRLDFAIPATVLVVWLALARPAWRRTALAGLSGLVAALAAQTALRLALYGAWLPNTYTLKMEGVPLGMRLARGLAMAATFLDHTAWPVFVLPALWVVLARRRDVRVGLLVGLFAAQLAYSAWVGGDAWEWWGHAANRFVMPALGPWLVVAALALAAALRALPSRAGLRALLAAAAVIIALTALHGGPRGMLARELVGVTGLHVAADETQVRYGLALREITDESATIAVAWAGAVPYFSERAAVDLLGKSDARVARAPLRVASWRAMTPGHDKHDFAWSLGTLRPDVVAHSYHDDDDVHLDADYLAYDLVDPAIAGEWNPRLWLRRDSAHVRWEAVARATWLARAASGAARGAAP